MPKDFQYAQILTRKAWIVTFPSILGNVPHSQQIALDGDDTLSDTKLSVHLHTLTPQQSHYWIDTWGVTSIFFNNSHFWIMKKYPKLLISSSASYLDNHITNQGLGRASEMQLSARQYTHRDHPLKNIFLKKASRDLFLDHLGAVWSAAGVCP